MASIKELPSSIKMGLVGVGAYWTGIGISLTLFVA